jgi:hypothetical protein
VRVGGWAVLSMARRGSRGGRCYGGGVWRNDSRSGGEGDVPSREGRAGGGREAKVIDARGRGEAWRR